MKTWYNDATTNFQTFRKPTQDDHITDHINALGPQQESSLVAWMIHQLPQVKTPEDAKRLLTANPSIYRYSEGGVDYYTTSSQDPR